MVDMSGKLANKTIENMIIWRLKTKKKYYKLQFSNLKFMKKQPNKYS